MTGSEGAFSGVLSFCQRRLGLILMYIIAIAWLYVTVLMAAAETSITAAIATFVLYGLFPLGLLLYLMGTPQRRRNRQAAERSAEDHLGDVSLDQAQSSTAGEEALAGKRADTHLTAQARADKPVDR